MLTAGALWALFGNMLRPVPNCTCTFATDGGFLICMRKIEEWYIWHLEMDESKICTGTSCSVNVRFELNDPDSLNRY